MSVNLNDGHTFLYKSINSQPAKLIVKYLPKRYNDIDELRSEIEEHFGDSLILESLQKLPLPEVELYHKGEDEILFEKIYELTGKKRGQFGFIVGTCHPLGTLNTSSRNYRGYEIWKINDDGTSSSKRIIPESKEHSLNEIVKFLNDAEETS